jgi:putative ABC transport system ATP-binding protein
VDHSDDGTDISEEAQGGAVDLMTGPMSYRRLQIVPGGDPRFVLELRDVRKTFAGNPPVHALRDVNLAIAAGELLAIVGPSGSGKSTLLNVMGTLTRPTAGTVFLEGRDVAHLPDSELSRVRGRRIGFVFQQYYLLDALTALDNVVTGLLYSSVMSARQRRQLSADALDRVGLGNRIQHRPQELSGGERQRVAIARAIVRRPAIVFADEPTGNLDSKSGAEVMKILHELHDEGTTIAVITHNPELAEDTPRKLEVRDGTIVLDERKPR